MDQHDQLRALTGAAQGALAVAVSQFLWDEGLATRDEWRLPIATATQMDSLCRSATTAAQLCELVRRATSAEALEAVPLGRRAVREELARGALCPPAVLGKLHAGAHQKQDWQLAQLVVAHPNCPRSLAAAIGSHVALYENAAERTLWPLRAAAMDSDAIDRHTNWPDPLLRALAEVQPDALVAHWSRIRNHSVNTHAGVLAGLGRWRHRYCEDLSSAEIRIAFVARAHAVRDGQARPWTMDDELADQLRDGVGLGAYTSVDEQDMFHAVGGSDAERQLVLSAHLRSVKLFGGASAELADAAIAAGMAASVASEGLDVAVFAGALADHWDDVADRTTAWAVLWRKLGEGVLPALSAGQLAVMIGSSERDGREWFDALARVGWPEIPELAAALLGGGDDLDAASVERLAALSGIGAQQWMERHVRHARRVPLELLDRYGLADQLNMATLAGVARRRPQWSAAHWYSMLCLLGTWTDGLGELLSTVDTVMADATTPPGPSERT